MAYRSRHRLPALLEALPPGVPVRVVDNSADEEPIGDVLGGRPGVTHVDAGANLGFGQAVNLAAHQAQTPFIVLVNPDCLPTEGVLSALVGTLKRDEGLAACAPALIGEDGAVQVGAGGWQPTVRRAAVHALGLHQRWPLAGISASPRRGEVVETEWLAGTCLALRTDHFLRVGGFDRRYFLYNEDMALGRRFRSAGFTQLLRGDLRVFHVGGGSSDIDPAELWKRRAQALAAYVSRCETLPDALGIRVMLAAGSGLRSLVYAARGPRGRAREMLTYSRWLLTTSWRR